MQLWQTNLVKSMKHGRSVEVLDQQMKAKETPWEQVHKKGNIFNQNPMNRNTVKNTGWTSIDTNRFEVLSEENFLHNDEREPKRTNAGNKQKQETYSRDQRQPQDMKSGKRKRILIVGDSQLHGIDQIRMSSKNDIKVRSQEGLKVQRLFEILDEEIQHKPEEVIVHVGVNNIENDNVEELIENFNEISKVYADRFKITFSGIIRRSDKRELNIKIDTLNVELKSLSLNKGHDFSDNNNINK